MAALDPPSPWTDWPARRMPGRAAFAAVVALTTTALVATVDLPLAMIGLALLAAATAEALLPTTYTLDAEGVTAATALGRKRVRWRQLRGWARIADGFALQGAGRTGLSRRRRSLVLHCGAPRPEIEDWLTSVAAPRQKAA